MTPDLTVRDAAKMIRNRELSSSELSQYYLDRIESLDSKVQSFIEVDRNLVLAKAQEADDLQSSNPDALNDRPLHGIPIGIKDLLAVKGEKLRCASKILENFISPYDATAISKLKSAGAIPMGRLNMDEFAMGSSNENSAYFPARNPWQLDHVAGGSSGGSAASVSANFCLASLGTDTGGSIRQPASFCGCVGLKPTYGRISRYGLVAFASSFDQIGPLTRNVEDAGLLLNILSGKDKMDSTSVPKEPENDWLKLSSDIKGLKVGIPKEYREHSMDPSVQQAWDQAIKQFESMGAEIHEISLPHTEYAIATYYILTTAEASSNLSRFEGIRYGLRSSASQAEESPFDLNALTRGEGFGREVKRRIILGTYVLSSGYYDAYYVKAQKARTLIRGDFEKAFEKVDVLVTPTSPSPAFPIGQKSKDPLEMYLSDIFTISTNLAGNCGISVPGGFSENPKLPIGLQITGPAFGESKILNAAYAFQSQSSWHTELPDLS